MKIKIPLSYVKYHSLTMAAYMLFSAAMIFTEMYYRLSSLENPISGITTFSNNWYRFAFIFWISSSIILFFLNIKMNNDLVLSSMESLNKSREAYIKDIEGLIHDNAEKKSVNINYTVEPINNNGTKPNKTTHKPKDYNN